MESQLIQQSTEMTYHLEVAVLLVEVLPLNNVTLDSQRESSGRADMDVQRYACGILDSRWNQVEPMRNRN